MPLPTTEVAQNTTLPEAIDRIAPTRRPPGPVVMRQQWLDLLFLHWQVPAEALQGLLPPGLTLDTFEGDAYMGLVKSAANRCYLRWD